MDSFAGYKPERAGGSLIGRGFDGQTRVLSIEHPKPGMNIQQADAAFGIGYGLIVFQRFPHFLQTLRC